MNIDIKWIQALADLATDKKLAKLTVEDGDKMVTIELPSANVVVAAAPAVSVAPPTAPVASPPPAASASTPAAVPSKPAGTEVTSPMVATFYQSASPDSPAFVNIGDTVAKGQTLCILEAMKQMNELESEVAGKVAAILVQNGQPVEYGQPLFIIQ